MDAQKALRRVRAQTGIATYLARLPEADRALLLDLIRIAKLTTADQFARRLLDDAIRRERDRRRCAVVRQQLRDEGFAHRWAEPLARAWNDTRKRGPVSWLWVDHSAGRTRALEEWAPPQRGRSDILDVRPGRGGEGVVDERGKVTPESVFAWLTGRPAPTGGEP